MDDERITLPSGRELLANNGIIGIDAGGEVFQGYDGHLIYGAPLSQDDREALAAIAIERWQRFARDPALTSPAAIS